jgi:hypothetical protein
MTVHTPQLAAIGLFIFSMTRFVQAKVFRFYKFLLCHFLSQNNDKPHLETHSQEIDMG